MRLNHVLPVLLCWVPLAALAQQSSSPAATPPAGAEAAPRTSSGQIQLDVVVTDKGGNPVAGLQRSDFILLDNDHPAAIQSFQAYGGSAAEPSEPAQIILIIDSVNLGFQEVSYSRLQIDRFLRNDGGRLANPVSIYWYTDKGIEDGLGPSTDGDDLAAKLDSTSGRLRDLTRAAGGWGAIERFEMSLQTLNMIAHKAAGRPGRKLLIWIGPGWPVLANPSLEISWKAQQSLFANIVELTTKLREAQMEVYSVTPGTPNYSTFLYESYLKGVKKPSQANLPNLDLKVVCVESGGEALTPSNDLAAEVERSARNAGAFYTIGFTPPLADGPNEYHELKVRVGKPGLTARTNTGYYNQPPGAQLPQPRD